MKMTTDTARTIYETMVYTITTCSYEATKKIPLVEDVNEMARMILPIYLTKILGVTEIGD